MVNSQYLFGYFLGVNRIGKSVNISLKVKRGLNRSLLNK